MKTTSVFIGNTHSLVIRLRFCYDSNLFPTEMFQDGKATLVLRVIRRNCPEEQRVFFFV